jgi:hypothetical protein
MGETDGDGVGRGSEAGTSFHRPRKVVVREGTDVMSARVRDALSRLGIYRRSRRTGRTRAGAGQARSGMARRAAAVIGADRRTHPVPPTRAERHANPRVTTQRLTRDA